MQFTMEHVSLSFHRQNHPDAAPSPIGQTDDKIKMKSFVEMCEWFEGSDDLCSVVEMRDYMIEKSEGKNPDAVYTVQTLKRKLIERYGEHLFFGEIKGRRDIVCLRNMASFIINSKWYSDQRENIGEETERIISAAAKLIRAQICETTFSKDYYPTSSEISDFKQFS